jgi:hypothetical protein
VRIGSVETGSGSLPIVDFGFYGDEPSGSATTVLISCSLNTPS